MHRALLALVSLVAAAPMFASDLAVGAQTIQTLITTQLFKQQGRWYLSDNGPCYAFLESPQTRLKDGRLFLDAHLSARLGLRLGGYCAGSGLASKVTLSGRLIEKGSTLTLDDIRIDHIEDAVTRDAVDLIRETAPQLLPKALSLDVLASVRGQPVTVSGIPVSLTQFHIMNVATRADAVVVEFDLSLRTP